LTVETARLALEQAIRLGDESDPNHAPPPPADLKSNPAAVNNNNNPHQSQPQSQSQSQAKGGLLSGGNDDVDVSTPKQPCPLVNSSDQPGSKGGDEGSENNPKNLNRERSESFEVIDTNNANDSVYSDLIMLKNIDLSITLLESDPTCQTVLIKFIPLSPSSPNLPAKNNEGERSEGSESSSEREGNNLVNANISSEGSEYPKSHDWIGLFPMKAAINKANPGGVISPKNNPNNPNNPEEEKKKKRESEGSENKERYSGGDRNECLVWDWVSVAATSM